MSANKVFELNLQLYEKAIALNPKIKRKGKTMPYTSLNGHMISIHDKDGNMGLRLPAEERDTSRFKCNTKLIDAGVRRLYKRMTYMSICLNL